MERVRWDAVRAGATAVAGILCLIGLFGPWVKSGTAERDVFTVVDLIERLGFAPGGVFAWFVLPLPLAPLGVVGAVVGSWRRRTQLLGAVLGLVVGSYAAVLAFAVSRAPEAGLISFGWGVNVALVGGVLLTALSAGSIALFLRARPPAPLDEHVAQ